MNPPPSEMTAAVAPIFGTPRPATARVPTPVSGVPAAVRPSTVDPEEGAIVRAAQAGSEEAFASLVRLHQRRAYAVARSIVLTHEDAEDAVQEAFLHAYKALHRFLPDQSFGAWLHRIVANASLDITRRRRVRDADELTETPAIFRDPGEARDLRDRLTAALEELGARQRAVIVLHDVQGFKHAEIGAMLGIPEGTARSDLHHARSALRKLLTDFRDTR